MTNHPELQPYLQSLVDEEALPGISTAVLRGGQCVQSACVGWADREAQTPLRNDSIFRAFSNTKLITSCAVLMMMERGHFGLDDPISQWLPELGQRQVLRPGATSLDDTEPALCEISIRHLLTHTAGFSHAVFDPGSLLHTAYHARGVRRPDTTLAELMTLLAPLPLQFNPGSAWDYAIGCDILARLIEVISGQRYGDFLRTEVLLPLDMIDTGYVLSDAQRPRMTALYGAANAARPMSRGYVRLHDVPHAGAFERAVPRQSGAGGLFTTQDDMLKLLGALLPGGPGWLRPETVTQMMSDQLPPHLNVRFNTLGNKPNQGFGLAGAVTRQSSETDGVDSAGELQWGGLAGTHWWIAPNAAGGQGLAGVVMTHRHMAFWHPFWFDFKRRVHAEFAG